MISFQKITVVEEEGDESSYWLELLLDASLDRKLSNRCCRSHTN